MNNNEKMLPSVLSKSTELTRTNQSSTELSRIPSSGEIIRAKSNIKRAEPNINQFNNGRGGGGGNGYGGPGGGNDETKVKIFLSNSSYHSGSGYSSAQSYSQSQYSSSESFCFNESNINGQSYASSSAYSQPQPSISTERHGREPQNNIRNNHNSDADDHEESFSKSPETYYKEFDIKKQNELLFGLGKVFLALVAFQLLLEMANAFFNLIAQISSSPLLLIALLIAGLFLSKKHVHAFLNKNAIGTERLKVIQVRALDYVQLKFKEVTLNGRSKGEYTLVRSQDQSK